MAPIPVSAGFDLFYMCSNIRAVTNCESLVKDFYSKLGLPYRDSSSDDEASQPTEIIEIPDEDDDVLSIDSGKRWSHGKESLRIKIETLEDKRVEEKPLLLTPYSKLLDLSVTKKHRTLLVS